MRPTLFLLSLSLLSLALLPIISADSLYSELPFKTTISLSAGGSAINAKATYLELVYYSAAKENNLPTDQSELYKPGDYSIDYQSAKTKPLSGAEIYFTFEGQKISDAGSATPACDPVVTDANGEAVFTIKAKNKAGNAIVTFKDGSLSTQVKVTVVK